MFTTFTKLEEIQVKRFIEICSPAVHETRSSYAREIYGQENMEKNYIELKDLEVYRLSRQLSAKAWDIYKGLNWQSKKIIGDQFIESIDSVGANTRPVKYLLGEGLFHGSRPVK